ncbi:hypothetical protein ACFWY9_37750 [Amycolatopsis sp. NPDC059027]|uniref:hypothetical protein n=1 Tax=Amycolatopsis sp. NPDC059027 TaxID=3346709 RepID=UPI003670D7F9
MSRAASRVARRCHRAAERTRRWERLLARAASARARAFVLGRLARSLAAYAEAGRALSERSPAGPSAVAVEGLERCAGLVGLLAETERAQRRGEVWAAPEGSPLTAAEEAARVLRLLAVEPDRWRRAELVRDLGQALAPPPGGTPGGVAAGDQASMVAGRFALTVARQLFRAAGVPADEAWRLAFGGVRDPFSPNACGGDGRCDP